MFSIIRKRLTIFNSSLMAFMLLVIVCTTYLGLAFAIYTELKQEVLSYAEEEARECVAALKHKSALPPIPMEEDMGVGSSEMFLYVFDNNGKPLIIEEACEGLRQPVLEKINNWTAAQGQVNLYIMNPTDGRDTVFIMMTSLSLKDGDKVLGTLYLGRDVSPHYRILKKFFIMMIIISLVSLCLVSIAGYIMAGRSMVPIKKSFDRQREFVADASHELRTPLSVLMASVDAIQGDENNSMSMFSQQVLSDMKDEIKKMTKIVGDLLTLARSDSAALKIFKEKFDLKPVAEQVVRSLTTLANQTNIRLILTSDESILVNADRERIAQLLLILLDNAIKYNFEGGKVEVEIKKVPANNKQELQIVVSDTGIGIASEYQQMVFERFYRVDKARSREMGGSGLGLPIAKWIVQAHGGSIKVESQMNRGSVFTVNIPS